MRVYRTAVFKNTFIISFLLLAIARHLRAENSVGDVTQFLKVNCIKCHGPEKSKAKIAVHTLNSDLNGGHDQEKWAKVLEVLKSGEMPPEDEPQPSKADRAAVVQWIDAGLRQYVEANGSTEPIATTRRLTNIEYQNTMRDLMGFELNLIPDLPVDPVAPYKFNNTGEFMLIGPEQMDRYREAALRVMASAIVDPGPPKIHKTERSWQSAGTLKGMANDEVGILGSTRGGPGLGGGTGLTSWAPTGEFRIRVKASAILPPGIPEMPLRLVLGYNLNENLATLQAETVGTVRLRNTVDHPQVFEFRGRIENYPVQVTKIRDGADKPSLMITAQNIYDNGRLYDQPDPLAMPRAVVESIVFEMPVTDVWPPLHHTRILFDSPLRSSDPKAYVVEVLKRFLVRAFRRPPTEAEVNSFVKVHAVFSEKLNTLEAAVRETLAMVLISPQFLYHTTSENGAARQYELASKLSYFLWASMPDETLLDLAAQGRLEDPAVIEAQVRRMLADRRAYDFANNFTTQWLSLAKMKMVKINADLFPRFLYLVTVGERKGTEVPNRPTIRDYMHEETVSFFMELIRRNVNVLNIVDSDFACLNECLAAHYGVEGVQGDEIRPVAIKPEHHLGGLLTQGSVLIGNSTGSAPHPIYRAVWLREAILGDEVPSPPADVPALSDTAGDAAEKAVTIKDLLRKHRQKESCNDCHSRLDPWGIPFEQYNATGRFQPLVPKGGVRVRPFDPRNDKDLESYLAYLKSINTVKVEADARVPNGPQVDGMEQLKAYLLKDHGDDIAKNVVRRLLAYAIGRELSYRDRFEVERLLQQSKANDYKLQDMIVGICQSPAFKGVAPKGK